MPQTPQFLDYIRAFYISQEITPSIDDKCCFSLAKIKASAGLGGGGDLHGVSIVSRGSKYYKRVNPILRYFFFSGLHTIVLTEKKTVRYKLHCLILDRAMRGCVT
jgi:hypothetical protein